ncbi:UV DNA damage repair endonuclease UvsE [Alkalicoccobacillus porphyridii]|uniref:UV DNA damage repair endonuclease UvsE n=1 Tax=Alkalicoccobacillus porphyridii TaxID=2597270 RepID=A0A553ZUZ6_9BACI|nr:UV DNA damage repair endonuclease UvsE [Alkalicoccobacillus porphyridii]TSB45145.1 UV DNA damage repair endonuclease UvsE [Alkalicoccobacillus porphyridii]
MRLGYPCQNLTLPTIFKTCRLKTMEQNGMSIIKDLTLHNIQELKRVLEWNINNDIYFFRISSDMIPFATHKQMTWVWQEDDDVQKALAEIKDLQQKWSLRLSMHPGQYTVLNSPREQVVTNAKEDLQYHHDFLKAVGGPDIILHTGGAYGDKEKAKQTFISVFNSLDVSVQNMLRLENDDKVFHTQDVLDISQQCGVIVCFDIHHEMCFNRTEDELLELFKQVKQTWSHTDMNPKVHISSGRRHEADPAHAELIRLEDFERLERVTGSTDVDCMLEAKSKEKAVFTLREQLKKREND